MTSIFVAEREFGLLNNAGGPADSDARAVLSLPKSG
jgi:hypothetical protein